MNGFKDAKQAWEIISETFKRLDPKVLGNLDMVYSYHFTDLNWRFSVILKGGEIKVVEGSIPQSETTLEMLSETFHQVMTGQINVMYAHLTNKARIVGSLGNVLKLRTIVLHLSKAYNSVIAEIKVKSDAGGSPAENPDQKQTT